MSSKPKGSKGTKGPLAHRSRRNDVLAIIFFAIAVLLILSLVTYDPKDPSWNSVSSQQKASNLIGTVGAYISNIFLELFGLAALAIPVLLIFLALRIFFAEAPGFPKRKAVGSALLMAALSGFLALFPTLGISLLDHAASNGGMLGYLIEGELASLLNTAGAAIVLTVASIVTLMFTMEVSLAGIRKMVIDAAQTRAESKRVEATMLEKFKAWIAEKKVQRELAAEAQRAEREAQRKAELEEQRRLEKELQAEQGGRRRQLSEEAVRLKTEDAAMWQESSPAPEPVVPIIPIGPLGSISPISRDEAVRPAPTRAAEDDQFADDLKAPRRAAASQSQPAASARSHAAAALRAYEAKTEQLRSGRRVVEEVTMDPEVIEMTSTAWIDRTIPKSEEDEVAPVVKDPVRRKAPPVAVSSFALPSVDLLELPVGATEQAEDELRDRATLLAEKCKEFSVVGHIHRINPGPVVTTFEFKPDPGVKYSRVVGLAEDLCLALKAESIRIDRIPGKSTVGIEVPNLHRAKILLREVIQSPRFQHSESKLTIALGKTINGDEYIADLARMPHMLIAGATGAGKSVTMNALICSILYKATPEEVKFIMVDPKRVELGLYEDIPHLLTPIVTEPKRAANALKWAVGEMDTRYKELAKYGVRNIEQYNRQVAELTHPTLSDDDPNAMKPLPYIVIAIDELADLMMVARSEVETSIARLAQMARAVGIHLVLATQRPSVDIITGVIKANIPSRVAFRVSQKVDSRTIIDANGAEALLGMGDMLFLPPGTSRLVRVHGSFVNEQEVKAICDHARNQAKPAFNETVTMSDQEAEGLDGDLGERDELYDQALAIVIDMGKASTSVLQRRLSIGYGRAAKILDMMEREGFIGPIDGAKARKVLGAAYEFRDRVAQRVEENELD